MNVMGMALDVIRLIRPVNCILLGFAVLVGMFMTAHVFSLAAKTTKVFLGFMVGFTFL